MAKLARIKVVLLKFVIRHKRLIVLYVVCCLIILVVPTLYANLSTEHQRYDLDEMPRHSPPFNQVAIVFGAGITEDGQPTPYLKNRVDTVVLLYGLGWIDKILMSGDNSRKQYSEPKVMKAYAIKRGVPAEDIILDYAGFNTYDSCYRARHIFGLKEATLVTQGYHLPRAVMTCKALGIRSAGVAAVRNSRDFTFTYLLRELVSTDKAVIQNVLKPTPTVLGKPEPIN